MKLLVVDDDTGLLDALHLLLIKKGVEVHTLATPQDIFKKVALIKPDIILMDIGLCEYDGRDLCYQLRSDPANASVKIILFSGICKNEESYELYGADDFIAKPFTKNMLFEKIGLSIVRIL